MSNLAKFGFSKNVWHRARRVLSITSTVAASGWFSWYFWLSPYLDSQKAVRNMYLHHNIQMTKVAAEAYAQKTGRFPKNTEEMKPLFPGGPAVKEGAPSNEITLPPGSPPVNPVSWLPEWPSAMTFETMDQMRKEALRIPCAKGGIVYIHIKTPDGYAIVARDPFGEIELWNPGLTRLR